MFVRVKEFLEAVALSVAIVGGLVAMVGGYFAYDEFRQSSEQRRIENRLSILSQFSPSLSYTFFEAETASDGLAGARIILQNETDLPINFLHLGGNYHDCSGMKLTPTLQDDGNTMGVNEFVFLPRSSLAITASTDPVENGLDAGYFAGADPKPFVFSYVFSASIMNISAFEQVIRDWGMTTGKRAGPSEVVDNRSFTWIYEFRAKYIHNGEVFIPYLSDDCELPNNRLFEIQIN